MLKSSFIKTQRNVFFETFHRTYTDVQFFTEANIEIGKLTANFWIQMESNNSLISNDQVIPSDEHDANIVLKKI